MVQHYSVKVKLKSFCFQSLLLQPLISSSLTHGGNYLALAPDVKHYKMFTSYFMFSGCASVRLFILFSSIPFRESFRFTPQGSAVQILAVTTQSHCENNVWGKDWRQSWHKCWLGLEDDVVRFWCSNSIQFTQQWWYNEAVSLLFGVGVIGAVSLTINPCWHRAEGTSVSKNNSLWVLIYKCVVCNYVKFFISCYHKVLICEALKSEHYSGPQLQVVFVCSPKVSDSPWELLRANT